MPQNMMKGCPDRRGGRAGLGGPAVQRSAKATSRRRRRSRTGCSTTDENVTCVLRLESFCLGFWCGRSRGSVHAIEATCLRGSHPFRPSQPIMFLEAQRTGVREKKITTHFLPKPVLGLVWSQSLESEKLFVSPPLKNGLLEKKTGASCTVSFLQCGADTVVAKATSF